MIINLPIEVEKEFLAILNEKNQKINDVVRELIEEYIEDIRLSEIAEESYQEYLKNPITYTFDEVVEKLGFNKDEL